ncbi:glycosyltransferase [Acinetobacter ursingii]|uniref:glycosyltransferase n=1 Tax=Acinetobacter ursingii TaxID=108980 RepID=UPI0021E20230|nr:glycosyltransferase [Acinetobacter ursingii]UYF78791.1 glycosyltransferase [Acinetobacter ursingii]
MIKTNEFDRKVSIITAVYNAENHILNLINSLRQQIDKNFEWVVVDGLSTDSTVKILKNIDDLNITIISEADFGIYDALNKGIKACTGEYYLVAGADDILYPNAVKDYKAALEAHIGIVTANIIIMNKVIKPNRGPSWRSGMFHWISQHSVGVLIKKSLHDIYGYYSKQYPIAADQLFIKNVCKNKVKCKKINSLVGEFGTNGTSSIDEIGGLTECFRIQLITEKNKALQYLLFILRLLKRYIKT